MIKKLISLVMTLAVLLSLASCSGKANILKIGDRIEFGNYKGHKTWRVLDIQGSEALLITEDIVDKYRFDANWYGWEHKDCDIRLWLNSKFIDEAFTAEERSKIINKTGDDVFLLSIEEAYRYFKDDEDRCLPTGDNLGYWLRSKGVVSDHAAIVDTFESEKGNISAQGGVVDDPRGVRPAVWIRLDKAGKEVPAVTETVSKCGCFTLRQSGTGTDLTGLTEKGKEQENLVIPAGVGFFGIIDDAKAKTVVFESDDDVDYGYTFVRMHDLESIKLPSKLTKLGKHGFCNNLKEFEIPEGVTVIPLKCFYDDAKLKKVVIKGNNLKEIRYHAFAGCESLETIELPDSVTKIENNVFVVCYALKEIRLPKNLKEIGAEAFRDSAIKTYIVPEEFQLDKWDKSSFDPTAYDELVNIPPVPYTVKVKKGSWADTHFDEVFTGKATKEYY